MQGAAAGQAAGQCVHHLAGQLGHRLVNAARTRGTGPFHGEEGLGHRSGNLGRSEVGDRTVAEMRKWGQVFPVACVYRAGLLVRPLAMRLCLVGRQEERPDPGTR